MDSLFDQGPPPACPSRFNMAAHVLALAPQHPDKIALAVLTPTGATRWSYGRLEQAVRGTATGLLTHGLAPGDRVLMRMGNTVDFPITYLAALTVGLIPVPTSSLLTVPEVTRIAAEIDPKLIVAEPGVSRPDPAPCPVIETGALADMHDLPPADFQIGDPDRPAYVIYTSGTAGSPRAVTHAHRAIWARRLMWDGWYGLRPDDRLLHAGAFNWTYTLGTGLMDPWSIGATALIPGKGVTPAQLPLLLKRHDATIFAGAPGVYRQLLRHDIPALPKLRHGLSAGEKMPDATRRHWEEATGTPVHEAFGMSECSTFVSGAPAHPAPPGTLGYPQPGRRVAVLGEDGPVPIGTPGTLAVSNRDPGLMLGYWGAEDETRARQSGEWFLTGDTVRMAEDGALTYLGRGDDMMNAGGVRVSPIEVESALTTHSAIHECAAVEVQVKADTTVIAAFYTADADLDPTELDRFAAQSLARYKMPRIYHRVDALPKNPNGKLQRRRLREDWETAHPAD
ncbi:class I adenylate-forming enzyme family protein [Psychromarinibacter sp. C21-152]|uniref:Class I adenylate-forming enzyme family protein n=1 Tax=Psychromarinibacter sediminicola TaxID=3033385 RepID=A0AAE3NRD2_9RHOB|nr:class I adenylate-forming enzyme family protein [Psychromarinibacter sediminicola]MDF0599550.1 class I adenylate-forming enzyme family protein [Psychromarinibacter sediminicola]